MLIALAVAALLGIPLLTAGIALLTERPPQPPKPKALNRDSAATAGWITAAVWVVLTVAGLAGVLLVDFYDVVASDRGEEISDAFRFLTALAMPVAAFVVAVLIYSLLRRSSGDLPPEDGEYFEGKGPFPRAWLVVTAALTLLIIIYPGLWTLNDVIEKHDEPDVTVQVEAVQWTWLVSYPELGVPTQFELVIPVDRKVTFEITSRDVVHSFWVPAFLMKIDAIPGHTTTMSLIATETGDFADDPVFRLQCAELCGLSHATMRIPLRVVSQEEFDQWVAEKSAAASAQSEE